MNILIENCVDISIKVLKVSFTRRKTIEKKDIRNLQVPLVTIKIGKCPSKSVTKTQNVSTTSFFYQVSTIHLYLLSVFDEA